MSINATSISSSKFSWLTNPASNSRPVHDIIVAENEHFAALPSLGSIVEGWIVIVPKRPMTTLSLMTPTEREALAAMRSDLEKRLSIYGKCIAAFEHGGFSGSLVSCGVDQAHLHLVPIGFDLLSAMRERDIAWHASVNICDLTVNETNGQEYLFAEYGNEALIGFPQTPTSQWFRQLIASKCGGIEWNYKLAPNIKQIEATASALMNGNPSRCLKSA